MKKALKVLSVLLCFALVLGTLVSCGGNPSGETTAPESSGENANLAADKVFNVGICQLVQHPALNAATQGFKEKLTALLGEDHVKFNE